MTQIIIVKRTYQCILKLLTNTNLNHCLAVEISEQPFIKLIPELNQYVTFMTPTVLINKTPTQIYHLPSTCLLGLENNEKFVNISEPLRY